MTSELEREIEALRQLGYELSGPHQGSGERYLVFERFPLPSAKYNVDAVRVLVRVPDGYPNAGLDMFYTQPDLRLASGAVPRQADVLETLAGNVWRRFSWHRNLPWVPGRDSLASFVSFVEDNLARGQ